MHVVGDPLKCPLTMYRKGVHWFDTIEQVIAALAAA